MTKKQNNTNGKIIVRLTVSLLLIAIFFYLILRPTEEELIPNLDPKDFSEFPELSKLVERLKTQKSNAPSKLANIFLDKNFLRIENGILQKREKREIEPSDKKFDSALVRILRACLREKPNCVRETLNQYKNALNDTDFQNGVKIGTG